MCEKFSSENQWRLGRKIMYLLLFIFFHPEGGVGQTQAWMPTYVSILRIPHIICVWRTTVE
jgi:hypothetical protein